MEWAVAILLILISILLLGKNACLYSKEGTRLYVFLCAVIAAATIGVGMTNVFVLCGLIG